MPSPKQNTINTRQLNEYIIKEININVIKNLNNNTNYYELDLGWDSLFVLIN